LRQHGRLKCAGTHIAFVDYWAAAFRKTKSPTAFEQEFAARETSNVDRSACAEAALHIRRRASGDYTARRVLEQIPSREDAIFPVMLLNRATTPEFGDLKKNQRHPSRSSV